MLDLGRTFLQSVERSPHALAIVDGETAWDYAQWHTRVMALADGLRQLGVQQGDRVLSVLQNRWEAATLHWACQMAGIVIVPLNWRVKPDELDYCLSDSEACAVVFEPVSAAAVNGSAVAGTLHRIGLDEAAGASVAFSSLLSGVAKAAAEGAAEGGAKSVATLPAASAEDYSLMLYTSGTTGRAKGVPRRHRQERAAALAHVAQNIYRNGERTLGVMPLYHTMGVRSLLAMAMVDGLFVCMRRWQPAAAVQAIAAHRVSCLYLVPTLYHDLLRDPNFAVEAMTSVRKIGFAGAPMSDALLKRTDAAFKPDIFVNHYGSSEVYTVSIDQHAADKPGSAGRAGLNTRMRIIRLDAQTVEETVSPGEEGQIAVELLGDEAFEGYWKRPEANFKSLRDGWYLSGDIGMIDSDGDLFVTGRVDDMIVSGGENISPVEIESLLSLHPAVDEVAVAGLPDERWGQRVVAYVKRSAPVDEAALDAYCSASGLVNFKRPRQYVFLDQIPKSPVGKILRRELRVMSDSKPEESAQASHPDLSPSSPIPASQGVGHD